jgi:hypothetical protein
MEASVDPDFPKPPKCLELLKLFENALFKDKIICLHGITQGINSRFQNQEMEIQDLTLKELLMKLVL